MSDSDAPTPAALAKQNEELNEQVKLLFRTEKRLFETQRVVERQLHRFAALNDLALATTATSERDVFAAATDALTRCLPVNGVLGVFRHDDGPAVFLVRDDEGNIFEPDEILGLEPPPEVLGDVKIYASNEPLGTVAALVAWLDARCPGLEPAHRAFRRAVFTVPLRPDGRVGSDLLICRSEALTYNEDVASERDRSFIELASRHIETVLGSVRGKRHLERRVEARTAELAVANEQLEGRLRELRAAQEDLVHASRKAGMAEVATSVLHNVGNVLNSVNISAEVVAGTVRRPRAENMRKAVEQLRSSLGEDCTVADRARSAKLLQYLNLLGKALAEERSTMLEELGTLGKNIDHIKAIVSMQQGHAKSAGVVERVSLPDLLDDAVRTSLAARDSRAVDVVREYSEPSVLAIDRHKLFEIVMNLLTNAADAVESVEGERRITIRTRLLGLERAEIAISDSGMGIACEHREKIFTQGFTTKRHGHGFGLHSCACAALELGGSLAAESEGTGQGATFRLVVPCTTAGATL